MTQSINNKDIFLREMTILTSGPDTQGCSRTGVALFSIHIFLLYKVILKIYQLVVPFKKECSLLSYFDFMTISVRIDIIYHDDFYFIN